jgi:CheY-like chemotaxis protein
VPTSPSHRDGWRIIATDRDRNRVTTVTEVLREAGHCVFSVQDGRSALELAIQLPNIDLLITNTRMGVMDGAELIRHVRYMRPNVRILHVVESDDDGASSDVRLLREPFTPEELLAAVGGLLR